MIRHEGIEFEVLAEVAVDAEFPIPGGCNSCACSCSNDDEEASAESLSTAAA